MLQSNLTERRVFVVGNGSLFDEGVIHLLTHETDLIVSRAIYSDNLAFQRMIRQDQPDVLLVCESNTMDTERILDFCFFILSEVDRFAYSGHPSQHKCG